MLEVSKAHVVTAASAPALPALDVTRCARGEDKVALFLQPPTPSHDVIDTYEVTYFTEEEKTLGIQQTLTFSNSAGQGSGARVMVLHKLRCGATYYFHLVARNTAGTSAPSDVVQCVTLAARHSVVPKVNSAYVRRHVLVVADPPTHKMARQSPVQQFVSRTYWGEGANRLDINVSKCRASSSCIRVFTPSPHDVAPEQHISHWLLYRPRGPESVWQAAPLYGSQEQRVAGLDPETDYQVVVMARNARGECQLSHVLGIRTQPAHTP
ncbi:hypothetical protein C0Q70_02252 [Pomacea canaliculata]|uniref:Fibronectin type-III domain-containing protein n=1 Tax=Pomacea canaliculata TaxID=400727 RepID=A0A2T7PPE3_POMCA|nr:hypothetical protein C0Q70_02252 [Pomacea canaliculata]